MDQQGQNGLLTTYREGWRNRSVVGLAISALLVSFYVVLYWEHKVQEHFGVAPLTVFSEAVGLRNARQLMPSELSGGMARRVALARAIALDPMMIMYDEPFTGQDPISMGAIVQLIRLLNDALGLSSIIVSHDVKETTTIADDIYVISEGRVVGHGTPEELNATDSDWVHQFMHGLPDGPVPFHYPGPRYADDLLAGSEQGRGT